MWNQRFLNYFLCQLLNSSKSNAVGEDFWSTHLLTLRKQNSHFQIFVFFTVDENTCNLLSISAVLEMTESDPLLLSWSQEVKLFPEGLYYKKA